MVITLLKYTDRGGSEMLSEKIKAMLKGGLSVDDLKDLVELLGEE